MERRTQLFSLSLSVFKSINPQNATGKKLKIVISKKIILLPDVLFLNIASIYCFEKLQPISQPYLLMVVWEEKTLLFCKNKSVMVSVILQGDT